MSFPAIAEIVRAWNASGRPEHQIRETGARGTYVRSAEARLGIRLPADYAAFLMLSNGWASTGDPLGVRGLRAVDDIDFFAVVERDWLQSWEEASANSGGPSIDVMRRAVVLSIRGERALLLDPATVDPTSGEPMCVFFDNDAPGVTGPPRSFTEALRDICESLAPALDHANRSIASDPKAAGLYARTLGGDLSAIRDLERMAIRNWFAYAVVKQHELVTNRISGLVKIDMLWWPEVPPPPAPSVMAEPLLHEEILPLYVSQVFSERRHVLVRVIDHAPPSIAETLNRCVATLEAGSEIVATFDYAPVFALAVEQARNLIPRDPETAWRLIVDALDVWQPRCDHHLAPLGLRLDTQLRHLLLHNVRRGHVPPRALEVLEHPRGRYATGAARNPDSG